LTNRICGAWEAYYFAGGRGPRLINLYADALSGFPAYAGRMGPAVTESEELPQSAMLPWISRTACAVIAVLVTIGAVSGMLGRPPLVIAASAAALAVSVAGLFWVVVIGTETSAQTLTAMTAVGLSGAVQVGFLPEAGGYLIVFVALIGIAMELPPRLAFPAGLVVFAAANISFLVFARIGPENLIGDDVGAAFLFTVGLFIRSARASQARSRAAQARAEGLLAELRASQAAQAEAATLTERTRLAREIHDILAHSLSGLVLALDTAELLARHGGPDTADADTVAKMLGQVNRAQRIAREGLADTRRAISALRGDELPGPALLDLLVKGTSEATGIHAELAVTGAPRTLAPEVGLALYRTAQEALINTAKYAGRGGRAELSLTYRPGDVELTIEDERAPGAAPPPASGLTFGGYGLTGMRERAELLGGTLTADPTERGFHVLLWLPTEQAAQPASQPAAHPAPHPAARSVARGTEAG
jgi:signal transduction histidine kinase